VGRAHLINGDPQELGLPNSIRAYQRIERDVALSQPPGVLGGDFTSHSGLY
jgi:hypothetical protein